MFLFSATFYPASNYGTVGRALLELSPLYHGVELVRSATTGSFAVASLGHVAFLALMGLAGLWATAHRLDGLLKD